MQKRTNKTQKKYDLYKATIPVPFQANPVLREWQYWKLVDNMFPYDNLFRIHHLLIPKQPVAKFRDLSEQEKKEYNDILNFLEPYGYDSYFINMPHRRTVPTHWHCHLVCWINN